ncbi:MULTISPECIES: hypothetical protein [unclassified Streptomyces]|uniref:hypothetical protein n=1 Tax=unclassified Streptomyces TaxID=2593676 RepID=UPI00131D455E|nr:hypothetical protein [Streptomyces sp. CB01373]
MSEDPSTEAGPSGEAGPVGPAPRTVPVPPPEPAVASSRRRRAGLVAGCVVLLAALAGGIGFTAVTVRGADRDPGEPVWRLPHAVAEGEQPEDTGLKAMLLPYGTNGYGRGPDLGAYGADAELSGAQAVALRKETLRNLPRSQRRLLEKQIDKQHITGMAMRSYLSVEDPGRLGADVDEAFAVEIVLSRMENRGTVRSIAVAQQEFLAAMKIFRAGPRIEGHRNARCFLPPADSGGKIDFVSCSAYEGDVLVSATAYGVKPLDKKGVARLLRDQLDRIKDPGKAV